MMVKEDVLFIRTWQEKLLTFGEPEKQRKKQAIHSDCVNSCYYEIFKVDWSPEDQACCGTDLYSTGLGK